MDDALMGVPPIGAQPPAEPAAAAAPAPTAGADFARWIDTEVAAVNTQMVSAEQGLRELAAGGTVSLHEVMMRAEEARLSFQLLVQMRNRVLEAYQDIMRMQA